MKLNHTKEQIHTWITAPLRLFESELVQDLKALHAEVERLTAELDKHRWIPVEERLPEECEDGPPNLLFMNVFPSGDTYVHSGTMFDRVFFDEDCNDYPVYGDIWPDYTGCIHGVTHWMPLPQRPEGTK